MTIQERIIETATKLFFNHGYNGVTITDIAKEANVSRVTLFKYFKDKETLAKFVVDKIIDDRIKVYEKINSDTSLSIRERFDKTIINKKEYRQGIDDRLLESPFMRDAMLGKLFGTAFREYYMKEIKQMVKEGKKDGSFDSKIPDEVYVDYLHLVYNSTASTDFLSKDKKYHLAFMDLICYGLFGNKPKN